MRTIVCETTGDWAAALRRGLPPGIELVETRSYEAMWRDVAGSMPAIVVLELDVGHGDQVLEALLRLAREFGQAIALVVADPTMSSWEPAMREAGAVHFISSRRRVNELHDIALRRLANRDSADEDDDVPLEQRILARLPWPRSRTVAAQSA